MFSQGDVFYLKELAFGQEGSQNLTHVSTTMPTRLYVVVLRAFTL